MTQQEALSLVLEERTRQNKKWGYPQRKTPFEWVSVLAEEVGEFAQATNDTYLDNEHLTTEHYHINKRHIIEEAIQVCAVALSIIEHMDTQGERT